MARRTFRPVDIWAVPEINWSEHAGTGSRAGSGLPARCEEAHKWNLEPPIEASSGRIKHREIALHVVAWMLALLAHGVIAWALARESDSRFTGGSGQQLDAVSISIVSSAVLESREPNQSLTDARASAIAHVEATEGANEVSARVIKGEVEHRKEESGDDKQRLVEEAGLLAQRQRERLREQNKLAAWSGGAAARGDADESIVTSGASAASLGVSQEYARQVSVALSKTKPRNALGTYGAVKVKFVILPDGRLESALIIVSSDNVNLDEVALEAVRRALFTKPPSGMSAAQLTFEISYRFR